MQANRLIPAGWSDPAIEGYAFRVTELRKGSDKPYRIDVLYQARKIRSPGRFRTEQEAREMAMQYITSYRDGLLDRLDKGEPDEVLLLGEWAEVIGKEANEALHRLEGDVGYFVAMRVLHIALSAANFSRDRNLAIMEETVRKNMKVRN